MSPCIISENGITCYSKAYKYSFDGREYYFEWHNYCGPSPLTKSGDVSERFPRLFWDMIDEFDKLSNHEKEKYRVR